MIDDRAYDSGGVVCVMTRRGDSGMQTIVLVRTTTYMPRIIFDWRDGLITSGRIHSLFTNVGSYVATLISTSRVTETERVTRRVTHTVVFAVEFVSDSLDSILLAHVSHQSELSGAAFLQLTGDACLST